MSHFTTVQMEIKNQQTLLRALEAMGFQPVVVPTGQQLVGYRGDLRPETAHIIIPRAQLHRGSNDIGFRLTPANRYELIISEFDAEKPFRDFAHKLNREYARQTVLETAERHGWEVVEETTAQGCTRIRICERQTVGGACRC